MSGKKRITVTIPVETHEKIVGSLGESSLTEKARELIEMGLETSEKEFVLDDVEKQEFFKHLSGGKGKEYHDGLKNLLLTETELVEMALAETGMTYRDLLKKALLSTAKEVITRNAKDKHMIESGEMTPRMRMHKAVADLEREMFEGSLKVRNGRLSPTRIYGRAGVNPGTGKKILEEDFPHYMEF